MVRKLSAISLILALISSPAWGEPASDMQDFTALSCQMAEAMRASLGPGDYERRLAEFHTAIKPYRSERATEDGFVERHKLYEKAQWIYHRIFGFDGFFVYMALIPDARIDYTTVLAKLFMMDADSSAGQALRKAAKTGTLNAEIVNHIWTANIPNEQEVIKKYQKLIGGNIAEPLLVGIGPTAEKLALWILSQPDRSITYAALWEKGIELAHGDAFTALGLISSVSAFDAAGRGSNETFMTDKIILPKAFAQDRDRAGVNYHFWCYMALTFVQSSAELRTLSFGYETVLQHDYAEGTADQTAITTANLALWKFSSAQAFKSCRTQN
jgi:hypothetical protein